MQIRDTERRWKQSCMFCMIKAGSEVTGSVPAPASAGLVDLDSGMVCTWPTFRLASSCGAGLLRLRLAAHCSPDLLHHEPAGCGTTRHCEQNLWVQHQQHFSWYFSSVFWLDALQRPIKCVQASVMSSTSLAQTMSLIHSTSSLQPRQLETSVWSQIRLTHYVNLTNNCNLVQYSKEAAAEGFRSFYLDMKQSKFNNNLHNQTRSSVRGSAVTLGLSFSAEDR